MDTSWSTSRRSQRMWVYAIMACFWQAIIILSTSSWCLADRAILIMDARPRYAFVSLQMVSSLRQGSKRSSSSFKKLSSLSSTPFPAATNANKPKRATHSRAHGPTHSYNATSWPSDMFTTGEYNHDDDDNDANSREASFERQSPFPTMPSPLFTNLAQSQFELLSHSLVHTTSTTQTKNNDETSSGQTNNSNDGSNIKPNTRKISSMVLYLPKENQNTGQLEFVPAVTFPNPSSERVFIASGDSSFTGGIHQPPVIPSPSMGMLGLPGFFKARDLIPTYPFVSSSSEGNSAGEEQEMFSTASPDSPISVSVVEEISSMPNSLLSSGPTSLSVTLFSGLDTLGVLMIWPYKGKAESQNQWKWTSDDKLQVTRAAKSLALALSMDNERASTQLANEQFRVAMADSLHQVKSPLQALRTFGKLLQRQLAEENNNSYGSRDEQQKKVAMERIPRRKQRQALKLAEDMMSQGERVIGLIEPMDALVQNRYLLRGDTKETSSSALVFQPSNSDTSAEIPQQFQLPPSLPILGEFELEMAFPQDILGSIVYASQAISRENGINFDALGFEPDNLELPGVTVCPKHLKEAVSNLLDNAIKYVTFRVKGKKGRPRIPQIKVTLVSNEPLLSPGATLYIEDNGPGIPKLERGKIFERGYRGEAVQDDITGSGLGLAIAREMISRMGGMLDLLEGDKGPNKLDGTTVRVILFRDPE